MKFMTLSEIIYEYERINMNMSKKKKALNREIYKRAIDNYKYNSDYDPNKEMCTNSIADKVDIYGTPYPNFDKNDYSKSMRSYKKNK